MKATVATSVVLVVVAIFAVARIAGSGGSSSPPPARHPAPTGSAPPAPPAILPTALPSARGALISDIDRAQRIIDDSSSTSRQLAGAGRFEQLVTLALYHARVSARRATLAVLGKGTAAGLRANLGAAQALSALAVRRMGFPDWRIVSPPPPKKLLGYFRAAQARFGVPWEQLAAIELIETTFGRVRGLSPVGARGPMQFMPATWARYGSGHIDNPRDAILSAARYLAANGAPGNMADALYHYNNSIDYIRAVQAYAGRMRADQRAYYGYYYWQVLYPHAASTVILEPGYPKVRPIPVNSLLGR